MSAAIEARPPRPGDTALLAALAEEARCDLAPYVPAETLRAIVARCRAAQERTMYTRNEIVTGDARELAASIPDGSVDLVFTDPIYERIEDYRWLAETAARVLRPGGALLAYYWCTYLPLITEAMSVDGLLFRWNVFDLKIGVASLDGGQGTRVMTRPALVYSKAHHDRSYWLSDVVYSRPQGKQANHEWSKNPSATIKWLSMMSAPGALVYDPFAGGGTVPAVCKMLGRDFIASEIDPATAERARERLAATTPPLPGIYAEQAPLDLEDAA